MILVVEISWIEWKTFCSKPTQIKIKNPEWKKTKRKISLKRKDMEVFNGNFERYKFG